MRLPKFGLVLLRRIPGVVFLTRSKPNYGDPWGFHAIKNVRVPLVLLQINFKYTTYLMNINLYIVRSYRIEINIFTFKTYFEAKNIMRIIDI